MIKKIALVIVLVILGFGLLNAPFLWQQIKFTFSSPDSSVEQAPVGDDLGSEAKVSPNTINIPSLGISAPIVESVESNEDSYQEALQNGVVHFPGTAVAGELGNAYYFGHSSDFAFAKGNYKTVFALLPRIEMGAEIRISDLDGKEFKYTVIDKKVVSNNDVSVLEQGERKEKLLSLQTSYPVGTALQRYVVVAKLVE